MSLILLFERSSELSFLSDDRKSSSLILLSESFRLVSSVSFAISLSAAEPAPLPERSSTVVSTSYCSPQITTILPLS